MLTPARLPLPLSRTGLDLVFSSATTRIYRLAGAQPYFTAAGCRVVATGRTAARVSCRQAATLVRRETLLPGWSARLDGRPIVLRRAGGLFQSVSVPAGTHSVTFGYAPPGMNWALVGLLAGCGLLVAPGLRARPGRRSAQAA